MNKNLDSILVIGSDKTESEIVAIICKSLGYDNYVTTTARDIEDDRFKYDHYLFAIIFEKFPVNKLKEFIGILRKKQHNIPIILFSKYSTLDIENVIRLPSITLIRNMKYALLKLQPEIENKAAIASHRNIEGRPPKSSETALSDEHSNIDDDRWNNIKNRIKQEPAKNITTVLEIAKKIRLYDTLVLIENEKSHDSISLFFHESYIYLIDYSKSDNDIKEIYNWSQLTFKSINISDPKDILFLTNSRHRWKKSEFIWNASNYLKTDTIKALNIFPEESDDSFSVLSLAPSFIISRYQTKVRHFSLMSIISGNLTLNSLKYRFPTHFNEVLRTITALYFGNIIDIIKDKHTVKAKKNMENMSDDQSIRYKSVTIKKGFLAKIIDKIRGL